MDKVTAAVELSVTVSNGEVHIWLPTGTRIITQDYAMLTKVIEALQQERANMVGQFIKDKANG